MSCEKCFSGSCEKRFYKMEKIIDRIKQSSIYKSNETEIEYGLENSIDRREYRCTISDIVESYYQGQYNCFDDIEKILSLLSNKSTFYLEGDIIKNIFGSFGIRNDIITMQITIDFF